MARTDYYAIQTPTLSATSQAIRDVNQTVGDIAPEDYPDLIGAMHSAADYSNVMDQLVEETVSGPIASFTDGANNLPIKSLTVDIVPTETGSGAKSPSNPYVIGGHTGINVTQTGKNLFNNANPTLNYYLTNNGVEAPYSGWNISDYIPVKSGVTYHFKPNSTSGGSARGLFYASNTSESVILSSVFNSGEVTITAPDNAKYVRFSYRDTSTNIQLELGSTATAYETPITPTTHHADFGQTVYGGEFVAKEGEYDKLTGWRKITLDGTQPELVANWQPLTNTIGFFYNFTNMNMKIPSAITIVPTGTSNKLNPVTYNAIYGTDAEGFSFAKALPNYERVFIRIANTSLTTKEAINDYLALNPIDIYYAEEVPPEIELPTETKINTRLGANNIYGSTGDVDELVYRANGALYAAQH